MKTLGLDFGGTYIKAGWLHSGRAHDVQRRPVPGFIDTNGRARELDPKAVLEAVQVLLSAHPGAESVWIAGQMSCFTFVDRDGTALTPLVSWQDERVIDVTPLAERLGPATIRALGNELRPGLPIATLSLTEAIPADISRRGQYTSLAGFIAGSLMGQWAPETHVTDAAASGMWDVVGDRWNDEAVSAAGLRPDQLPAGTWSCAPIGRTSSGALVHAPLGDQQASLLGAGLRPGALSMNIATGGQASAVSTSTQTPADVQLRPYLKGSFLHTITHLPAGRALTAVVRLLNHGDTSAKAWDWAARACAADHDWQVQKVHEPHWDLGFFSHEGGSLTNLTGATTAAECMTAAVTEVAQAFIAAAHRLGEFDRLIFSGGLVQKFEPLRQAIAAGLNRPAEVHTGDDATLDGLARLAQDSSDL